MNLAPLLLLWEKGLGDEGGSECKIKYCRVNSSHQVLPMFRSVEGVYQDGKIQLVGLPEGIPNQTRVKAKDYLEQLTVEVPQKSDRPIWEIIDEIVQDISAEMLEKLPTDGAEQHDRYIYGTSKRKQ